MQYPLNTTLSEKTPYLSVLRKHTARTKLFFLLLLATFVPIVGYADTIYSETFGTPTSSCKVSDYTAWSCGEVRYSGTAGIDYQSSKQCTLSGSSRNGYLRLYTKYNEFCVSGINTMGYKSLSLSFNYKGSVNGVNLTIQYSLDGTTYKVLKAMYAWNTWEKYTLPLSLVPSEALSLKITLKDNGRDLFIDDLSIEGTALSVHPVEWFAGDDLLSSGQCYDGQTPILPDVPAPCGDKVFVGWTQQSVLSPGRPEDLFPSSVSAPRISAPTTFYAVYAHPMHDSIWEEIRDSSMLTTGEYVLLSSTDGRSFQYLPNTRYSGSNPILWSLKGYANEGSLSNEQVKSDMRWHLAETTDHSFVITSSVSGNNALGHTETQGKELRISSTYSNRSWYIRRSAMSNWLFSSRCSGADEYHYLAVYDATCWAHYTDTTVNQNGTFHILKCTPLYTDYSLCRTLPRTYIQDVVWEENALLIHLASDDIQHIRGYVESSVVIETDIVALVVEPDGSIRLAIDDLNDYVGKDLTLQFFTSGSSLLSEEVLSVPLLVGSSTSISALASALPTVDWEDIDLVVLPNASLSIDRDFRLRSISLYHAAELATELHTTLSLSSLSLLRKGDAVPNVQHEGSICFAEPSDESPIRLRVRITPEDWHWFSLPEDCNLSDVRFSDGSVANYGEDWFLMYYDGAERAANRQGGWKPYREEIAYAGQGYVVGIADNPAHPHYARELLFPLSSDVLSRESGDKYCVVYPYGKGTSVGDNNKGWNLVGNPYLHICAKEAYNRFEGITLYPLQTGSTTSVPEMDTDNPLMVPYIVVPIGNGRIAYEQVLASAIDILPYTSYFIQVDGTNQSDATSYAFDFSTGASNRNRLRRFLMAAAPELIGIILTNERGETDETTFVVGEQFTASYEANADFFKWFGDDYRRYTKPVLYTLGSDGGKRAFNAIPKGEAVRQKALGMYLSPQGSYTLSVNPRCVLTDVSAVLLHDTQTGITTDLLEQDYSFTTSQTESEERFFVALRFGENMETCVSHSDSTLPFTLTTEGKAIAMHDIRSLPMRVRLYDVLGHLIEEQQVTSSEYTTTVPTSGVYYLTIATRLDTRTVAVMCR